MLVRPVSVSEWDVSEMYVPIQTVVPRLTYTRGTAIIMPYGYFPEMFENFTKLSKFDRFLEQNALGELHTC